LILFICIYKSLFRYLKNNFDELEQSYFIVGSNEKRIYLEKDEKVFSLSFVKESFLAQKK